MSAEHIQRQYGVKEWTSDEDFLTQLARMKGKLLKGGEPDLDGVAKSMIYDWQRVSSVPRNEIVGLLTSLAACVETVGQTAFLRAAPTHQAREGPSRR